MNQKNRVLQTYGLWLIDSICILAAYQIATYIRFSVAQDWGDKTLHYMVCVLLLLFGTAFNFFADWNRDFIVRGYLKEAGAVIRYVFILITVTLVAVFFLRWSYILSRSVMVNFLWMVCALMYTARSVYKAVLRRVLRGEANVSKVIVIAEPDQMEETIRHLQQNVYGCQPVGGIFMSREGVEEEELPAQVLGVPVSGGGSGLTEKLTQIPFDEVLIHTPNLSQKRMRDIIIGLEEMGVVCHYCLDLPDMGEAVTKVENVAGYSVISYTRFRSSYKRLWIKRGIDIIGGLVGLLLTAVLTLFIAPAIKLDSPGPVFFSQVRVGKNARRFRIYKFRSMYQDAEQRLKDLEQQNEMSGLMFKMKDDPRITRVGRFLRKTSLDEFPQFWNVLKGDMSLVGTRPPTESEFEQYNEHYRRRLSMTPALTGMWQVSGRSDIEDFDEVVKLDLEYIDNWSLSLDFKILLQTVGVVLLGRGAK